MIDRILDIVSKWPAEGQFVLVAFLVLCAIAFVGGFGEWLIRIVRAVKGK